MADPLGVGHQNTWTNLQYISCEPLYMVGNG